LVILAVYSDDFGIVKLMLMLMLMLMTALVLVLDLRNQWLDWEQRVLFGL
jgi:NADH:ubiquinone oxidoreductase subunit 3 (subunit A)